MDVVARLFGGGSEMQGSGQMDWMGTSPPIRPFETDRRQQPFLILPGWHIRNLASRTMALCLKRLGDDWMEFFGHRLVLVETFVDPEFFQSDSRSPQSPCRRHSLPTRPANGRSSGKVQTGSLPPLSGSVFNNFSTLTPCPNFGERHHPSSYLFPVNPIVGGR